MPNHGNDGWQPTKEATTEPPRVLPAIRTDRKKEVREGLKTSVMYLYAALKMDEKKLTELFFGIGGEESDGKMMSLFCDAMHAVGIDIGAVMEGWEEDERILFEKVLGTWAASVRRPLDGAVFAVIMRHFLIPAIERKNTLEKMIILTGKGDET